MATYQSTSWLNSNPNLGIDLGLQEIYHTDTTLNCRISFVLQSCTGYNYWGYGASISWGYYHPITGAWIQGEEHQFVDTSISQWNNIEWVPSNIILDVGYGAGTLNVVFTIYSNGSGQWGTAANGSGQWGTAANGYFSYDATSEPSVGPSRGDVSYYNSGTQDPYDAAWFDKIHLDFSNFSGGTAGVQYYGVWKYEYDNYNSSPTPRSGIAQLWTYGTGGTFDWDGKPPYPMYYFRNVYSGKYLDVVEGIFQNDQRIQTYDFNGLQAQRWGLELVPNTSDRYYFHPDCTFNAMIHTVNTETTSGTELCLWTYTGAPTTQWIIDPTGDPDGSVYIRLVANVNQVINANMNTGGIVIYQFNGQDNQKWIMEDASDAWLGRWMSFDVQVMDNNNVECEAYAYNTTLRMYIRPGTLVSNQLSWSTTGITWQGGPVTCMWAIPASDNTLRSSDTYELIIERQYNGIWHEFHHAFNDGIRYTFTLDQVLTDYEYRYKVRAYNIYNAAGPWSEYSHNLVQHGPDLIQNKNCAMHVVKDGKWVPVNMYIPNDGKWEYSMIINPEGE